VSENRVLRRVFGPKRDELTVEWRTLHNEELNDLYSSPNIIRVINSRRMRWVGGVCSTYWGEERCIHGFGEETRGKALGVDGRIILRWIFRKWDGGGAMVWLDLAQDRDRWRDLVNATVNLLY